MRRTQSPGASKPAQPAQVRRSGLAYSREIPGASMSQRPYLQIRPGSDQPHFAIAELQAITAPVRAMELCRDGLSNRRDHAVDDILDQIAVIALAHDADY